MKREGNIYRTLVFIFLVGFLNLCCLTAFVEAAEPGSGWLPWGSSDGYYRSRVILPGYDSSRVAERSGLSPAELNAMLDNMSGVLEIVKQIPAFNPPQGFEIKPNRHILPRREDGGQARGLLWLTFWVPNREQAHGYSGHIQVVVNDMLEGGCYAGSDEHGSMYLQFPVLGELGGYLISAVFDRDISDRDTALAIFPQERTPPWQPVSQERWIRYLIDYTRESLEEVKDSVVSTQEERAQGLIDFYEKMISELPPEQAAEFMETGFGDAIEEAKAGIEHAREIEAAMEAEDYDRLEELGRRRLAMRGRSIFRFEEELESLGPEERKAPAYGFEMGLQRIWYTEQEPERSSLLLDPDDPRARPLIAPVHDDDFYCSESSPTDIQSLLIVKRAPPMFYPTSSRKEMTLHQLFSVAWDEFVEEIREGLDLEALANMTYSPPVR